MSDLPKNSVTPGVEASAAQARGLDCAEILRGIRKQRRTRRRSRRAGVIQEVRRRYFGVTPKVAAKRLA